MGCIPGSPHQDTAGRLRNPSLFEDTTMMSSIQGDIDRSVTESSCPYQSVASSRSASSSPRRKKKPRNDPYYPNRPSFLTQLIQTVFVLAVVGFFGFFLTNKTRQPAKAVAQFLNDFVASFPQYLREYETILLDRFNSIDWTWLTRKPEFWWDTEKVDWDDISKANFWVAVVTLNLFVMDLLFSCENKQGNPIMLFPLLLYCLEYAIVSIHAQASHLLQTETYMSFNTTKIGDEIFKRPQMVVMTFTHLFALDLGLNFVMMKDFYSRISSRRLAYRLIMVLIVGGTIAQGISTVLIYLTLRFTLFSGPLIHSSRHLPTNPNSYKREVEYLLDPIPRGSGALNGWVQSIPSPLNLPFFFFFVLAGTIRFFVTLVVYLLYVTFICIPVSAVFFSLRRSWRLLRGKQDVQGALYSPLETVDGKVFPPKAVLVVTAHLRLICFVNRSNHIFNAIIGWWLRRFLEAAIMYEFTLPFKDDFSPYVAFLMSEFGPVFPMGNGLGFGSYKHVKSIIENPDQRKSGLSLAWSISSAQHNWSKNLLTSLPEKENEKSVVAQGRQIVWSWLADVNTRLKDPIVRKRLDAMLPFANLDGSMVDKTLIETAFGSTLFHLLTGGDFTKFERKRYHKLLTNAFPFMSDFINKTWFGGILEYKGMRDYDVMRRAFLRYPEADSLQRALALAEEKNWDDWNPAEVVRFLVFKFSIAAGAAPAFALGNIVEMLFKEPDLAEFYIKNSKLFILEAMRLQRGVPLVNFMAHDFELPDGVEYVTIFDKRIPVPNGTPLHCSIQNANRDVSVFGTDAGKLNFQRDPDKLKQMLTFNGNINQIEAAGESFNFPPRRCPGYENATAIMEFLVDRYRPKFSIDSEMHDIPQARLEEIKCSQTTFQNFVLMMGKITYAEANKYFPTASDVKHPLDSTGRNIGHLSIVAAGKRSIPVYDEDVPAQDAIKDKLTAKVLSAAPIYDDEGEWESPEEAIEWRNNWFSSNFPPVNTDYTGAVSVSNLVSQMAVSGIGCLHTQTFDSLPSSSAVRLMCKDDSVVYVNDNTALGAYRVRRGYDRYGAAAYFDRSFQLVGIYTCSSGEYLRCPSSLMALQARNKTNNDDFEIDLETEDLSQWRHAMWIWRVSTLALVTVADHLVNVHMIAANSLVTASRLHLSISHPLRSFLKIFTYRTIGINLKAYHTLVKRKGVVNRNWAFEEDDLQNLLESTPNTFKKNFKHYIPESMRNVKDYPVNQDLTEFCDVITKLVKNFLLIVYGSAGSKNTKSCHLKRNMDNDPELQSFLEGLAKSLDLVHSRDLSSFDDIVDTFTSLICNVTGMHELVGQISDYFVHPKICGTTIRRGKEIDSIQIYQLNCTLVSSTGLRMPRLMGNWEHLVTRNRYGDEAVVLLREFQKDLENLSVEIDKRNDSRAFPMSSFDPVHLESSVSI
ncbi:hypothetical protein IV203_032305 [Nitzschia inconspicua]|uniref:Uncharacterized protein n=1 Tax=Nitzschia inconspicua TaxID=303405 RepID=A0A9K3PH60_9STRA|nr:hypothetical protein IV203_032305 [Nitzschia inconspicua]